MTSRSRSHHLNLAFYVSLAFVFSLRATGQTQDGEMGLKPFGSYHSGDFDNVNLANGNVFVKIPLFSVPQRGGAPLSYSLYYNSNHITTAGKPICGSSGCSTLFVWVENEGQIVAKPTGVKFRNDWSNAGIRGPYQTFGYSFCTLKYNGAVFPNCLQFGNTSLGYVLWYIRDATGAVHAAYESAPGIWRSSDGSDLMTSTPIQGQTNPVATYDESGNSASAACALGDPNGNCETEDGSSALIDTVGRPFPSETATTNFTGCATTPRTVTSASTVSIPSVNGGTVTYTFCYVTINVIATYLLPDWTDPSTGTQDGTFLQSVILPDGTSWQFQYDGTTGDLTQFTLPTGGTVSYQYYASLYPLLLGDNVATRTVNRMDGTGSHSTNYSYGTSSAGNPQTTVTDAALNDSVHTFIGFNSSSPGNTFYESLVKQYQGSANGNVLLKTVATDYQSNGGPPGVGMTSNVFPFRVTTTLDNGLVSKREMTYDQNLTFCDESQIIQSEAQDQPCTSFPYTASYGKVISQSDFDWGNGSPGPLLRRTTTDYKAFDDPDYLQRNLLSLPSQSTTYDGNGTMMSQTTYGYDESALTPSGLPAPFMPNPPDGSKRGNLTSVARWVNTGVTSVNGCPGSGSTVTTRMAYYDTGEVQQSTDACGNASTYTYSSVYADAYPTSIMNALGQATTKAYDFNTGLLTSSTDPNGNATTYSYGDSLRTPTLIDTGKLTDIIRPEIYPGTSTHGHTQFSYTANSVDIYTTINPSATKHDSVTVEGFGRTLQTRSISDPQGTVYVDTGYDQLGRVASTSNPYRISTGQSGSTSFVYDALNRKTRENKADGTSFQKWSYTGTATTFTDEASNVWTRSLDGLGRLAAVVEPGGLQTTYSYDILGNLKCVDQWGTTGASAPCSSGRHRSFNYDSLSRLLNATNPETGTTNYGYDSNGNVMFKLDARGEWLFYNYDALNRLTHIYPNAADFSSTAGSFSAFGYDGHDEFTSAALPQATGPQIGRLTRISNDFNANSTFSYDAGGRVINQIECLPSNCSGNLAIQASYDLLGNMISLVYPDGRTIQQNFDSAGRLSGSSAVSSIGGSQTQGFVGSLSYNPDGSTNMLTLGNGVTQTIQENNRLQVQCMSISSTGASCGTGSSFLSHTYCYVNCAPGNTANNGNIWGIVDNLNGTPSSSPNTQGFTYDALNRIASFSLGGQVAQQYTIDSFGNMSGLVNGAASMTFNAANQINNLPCATAGFAGYDAAGHQTCFTDGNSGSFLADYTADDRLWHIGPEGSGWSETYSYRADGQRVEKLGSATSNAPFTDYVYFGGQVLSEVDQTGGWTDYIYANGQKVAMVPPTDPVIHTQGTSTGNWTLLRWNLPTPQNLVTSQNPTGGNYTVKQGDKLCFRQYAINGVGGPIVWFSNGASSVWSWYASDGQWLNQMYPPQAGGWVNRCVDLTGGGSTVGSQISTLAIFTDSETPAGHWDIYYADMSITSTDGTVTNIIGAQPPTPVYGDFDGDANGTPSATVEKLTGSGPTVQQVQVRFTNDSCSQCGGTAQGGGDRNLFVTSVTVGSQTVYATDPTVQCLAGCTQSLPGFIYGNGAAGDSGDLLFPFSSQSTGPISVQASGSPDYNVYPQMEVLVNGVVMATVTVSGSSAPYSVAPTAVPLASTHFFFSDHLGSAQMEFASGGWPVSLRQFAPYGAELDTQSTFNHYKFTGKERDAESGLDYFGARYYASSMGRWMSPDWADKPEAVPYSSLDDPQSLNLYGYVRNNPLSRADADGHEEGCCTLPSLEEIDAVARPLIASAAGALTTGVEFTVSTALAPVVAIGGLIASPQAAGNWNDDHPSAQTRDGRPPSATNPVITSSTVGSGGKAYEDTPDNQARMAQGKPPIGKDGKPVELHSPDQTHTDQSVELTRTDHRGAGNFAANHTNTGQQPTQVGKGVRAQQRRAHWKNKNKDKQQQ